MKRIAIALLLLFVGLHLLGGREHVGFISGNVGCDLVLGAGYVLAWFGACIAAPILLLASALEAFGRYAWPRARATITTWKWSWRSSGAR